MYDNLGAEYTNTKRDKENGSDRQQNEYKGISCFIPKEESIFIRYVMYKVQLAFYEIFKENAEDISWNECILLIQTTEQLQKASRAVAEHAMRNFSSDRFNFEIPVCTDYVEDEEDNRTILLARIFSERAGTKLIHNFILRAQIAHFSYLSRKKGLDYTWERYIQDLKNDTELLCVLARAFQDGLKNIDFNSSWLADGIKETEFLWEAPEERSNK